MNCIYTYNEEQKCYSKVPFPSKLRMVIIRNFGSGTTKLLFKFFSRRLLIFSKNRFCIIKLSLNEYDVIIKSLKKFYIYIHYFKPIIKEPNSITDIDNDFDIIISNDKFKRTVLEIQIFNYPDFRPLPNELNPQGLNKTLVIIDDCTINSSVNSTQLFIYGRPLNINTNYLLTKYTKVPWTISENCNGFILLNQSVKNIIENIYNEIGHQFDNDKEMINLLKLILQINMILICYIKMMVNNLVR